MEKMKITDTQEIITIEDAVSELNKLYIQMTYDVEFMEKVIEGKDNGLKEERKKETESMAKFLDDKFKDNSIEKLKYLIENIKEMLIKIPNESKENSTIKSMLISNHRKFFAAIIIMLDNLKLVDLDAIGQGKLLNELELSKEEEKELYEQIESLTKTKKEREEKENKLLYEINKEKVGALKDITFITDISEEENEYGMFAKDKDKYHIICESDEGRLIALSSYKAYQNKNSNNTLKNQLDVKTITKYEFQIEENGENLSISFFGEPNLEIKIKKYGSDYVKVVFLAVLAAKRNKQGKMEHIGTIERIDKKIYKSTYDRNLEKTIKQLVNDEEKKQAMSNNNIERDEK